MKQYPEQAAVLSLEELLDGKDSVTFDHCSILIDSQRERDVIESASAATDFYSTFAWGVFVENVLYPKFGI